MTPRFSIRMLGLGSAHVHALVPALVPAPSPAAPIAAVLALALAAALGLGCSSTSSPAATLDGGGPAIDSGASAVVNGCDGAAFTGSDHTSATDARAISFPGPGMAPMQYTPACMTIRAGQSVTWSGGLGTHPLEAFGGDVATPIMATTTGTSVTVVFPATGVFGFHCANHPLSMLGAIKVIN